MINIEEIIKSLPDHWEVFEVDSPKDHWSDDGRDYNMPMFARKDGLARIYFNKGEDETSDFLFAIAWDWHADGDCYGNFADALKYADKFVQDYPLSWNEETKKYE